VGLGGMPMPWSRRRLAACWLAGWSSAATVCGRRGPRGEACAPPARGRRTDVAVAACGGALRLPPARPRGHSCSCRVSLSWPALAGRLLLRFIWFLTSDDEARSFTNYPGQTQTSWNVTSAFTTGRYSSIASCSSSSQLKSSRGSLGLSGDRNGQDPSKTG